VQDHSDTCPRCGDALEPGFAAVSLDGTITELFWVAGRIERERLTRGARIDDRTPIPLVAERCPACDTVAFSAPKP
jgi:hypothetical protein